MKLFKKHRHTARINNLKIDVHKLHALTEDHPVETVSSKSFDHELTYPCWSKHIRRDTPKNERIAPAEVIDTINRYGPKKASTTHPEMAYHIKKS